jgi:hypothetical protein
MSSVSLAPATHVVQRPVGCAGLLLSSHTAPNQGVHLTASSVRCAPASGSR